MEPMLWSWAFGLLSAWATVWLGEDEVPSWFLSMAKFSTVLFAGALVGLGILEWNT